MAHEENGDRFIRPGQAGVTGVSPVAQATALGRAPDPADADPLRLTYALGRMHAAMRSAMAAELARRGLTISEFTALSVLGLRSGLSNAQLARRSLVTPQAMNKVLSALEGKGLVTRGDSPGGHPGGHHRARRIELTEAGRLVLQRAEADVAVLEAVAFYGTTAQERALLVSRLQEATERLGRTIPMNPEL